MSRYEEFETVFKREINRKLCDKEVKEIKKMALKKLDDINETPYKIEENCRTIASI